MRLGGGRRRRPPDSASQPGSAEAQERQPRPARRGHLRGTEIHDPGLREYIVVHGTAAIEEGGAPELLQELAKVHLGPDVKFPPMEDPPPGVRIRITVEKVGGVGPWT